MEVHLLIWVALCWCCWCGSAHAKNNPDSHHNTATGSKWTPETIGDLLLKGVSLVAGQRFVPEFATPDFYREYAISDTSNDDAIDLSPQEILQRSGYDYENHYVTSDDGYITLLVRVVNPLVERQHLKRPPVVMFHGGIIDQKVWIWASAIQHHPERYPRVQWRDGPITSWNRSLALVLANNGYDVWLVGTRGANEQNQRHTRFKNTPGLLSAGLAAHKTTGGPEKDEGNRNLLEKINYWNYTMDELAQFEFPRQIDKVLQVTGAQNVSIVTLSLSTMIAPMLFAQQPEYLHKVHNTVVVMPMVSNRGANRLGLMWQHAAKMLPTKLGTILVTELIIPLVNHAGRLISRSIQLRYTLLKAITLIVAGPSAKYATLLEPPVYANVFLPLGFKQIKHVSQILSANKLQKFDHGLRGNMRAYGTMAPPSYETSKIDFGDWMLVSAEDDVLAPPRSIEHYLHITKRAPIEHLFLKQFSHLDCIAGFHVDTRVNLPVLRFFDRFHLPPPPQELQIKGHERMRAAAAAAAAAATATADDDEQLNTIQASGPAVD